MSRKNKELRRRLDMLRRVHEMVPSVACKGQCQGSCGPIKDAVLPIELEAVRRKLGDPAFEFTAESCGTCPLLGVYGECTVHDVRPVICRMWGVVRDNIMRCPHNCITKGLSNAEAQRIWSTVALLDRQFKEYLDGKTMGRADTGKCEG